MLDDGDAAGWPKADGLDGVPKAGCPKAVFVDVGCPNAEGALKAEPLAPGALGCPNADEVAAGFVPPNGEAGVVDEPDDPEWLVSPPSRVW